MQLLFDFDQYRTSDTKRFITNIAKYKLATKIYLREEWG